MKLFFRSLCIMSYTTSILLAYPVFAQNTQSGTSAEQWQLHTTKNYQSAPTNNPAYYKTPSLKPAKKNMHNPLRRQGWHTHPDPYIEEGGVYTNAPHPAITQHGKTLDNYSNITPDNYMAPPSSVMNPYRGGSRQQAVKIEDPLPGKVAPIPLPPAQN